MKIKTDSIVTKSTLAGLAKGVPFIIHQGGAYSGKTFNILIALGLYLHSIDERKKVSVIGQTVPHLKEGALADWEEIDAQFGFSSSKNNIDKKYQVNKSEIHFMSVDTLGKAKGPKRDILFVNEANEFNYKIFKQLSLRTNDTVIIDYNPTGTFWLQQKELPSLSPDSYIFKLTTYKDNPGLPKGKAEEIEALKFTDEHLYQVYALGETGRLKGQIFTNYSIVDKMPKELKKEGYGLDFGFANDPTALIRCGLSGGDLYLDEIIYKRGLTNKDIADKCKAAGLMKSSTIIADSAEPKSIAELKIEGLTVTPAKKGKDSIMFGIQLLKKYEIKITRRSTNLIHEFSNYRWKMDNSDEPLNVPVDDFNHGIDGIRYYAMSMVQKKKTTRIWV